MLDTSRGSTILYWYLTHHTSHFGVIVILKGFKDISMVGIPKVFAEKSSGSYSFLQPIQTLYKQFVNRLDSPTHKRQKAEPTFPSRHDNF
jgi:hypothetical protein